MNTTEPSPIVHPVPPSTHPAPAPRHISDAPWAWATKDTLRLLHERFSDSGCLASTRSVYLALCEVASDKQSETFQISVASLSARSGNSNRWTRQTLKHLEEAGVISVQVNRCESGLNLPSTYTLLAHPAALTAAPAAMSSDEAPTLTADVRRMEEREEKEEPLTPYPRSHQNGFRDSFGADFRPARSRCQPQETAPAARRRRSPAKGRAGAAFDQFWTAYPKKRRRPAAEEAWVEMDCEEIAGEILAALEKAIVSEEWAKEDGRYIPHPANWLADSGWEDCYGPIEPPAPKEPWRDEWLPWLKAKGCNLARNAEYQYADPLVKNAFWKERKSRQNAQ